MWIRKQSVTISIISMRKYKFIAAAMCVGIIPNVKHPFKTVTSMRIQGTARQACSLKIISSNS